MHAIHEPRYPGLENFVLLRHISTPIGVAKLNRSLSQGRFHEQLIPKTRTIELLKVHFQSKNLTLVIQGKAIQSGAQVFPPFIGLYVRVISPRSQIARSEHARALVDQFMGLRAMEIDHERIGVKDLQRMIYFYKELLK